jgi:hypothetical protein
MNNRIQTIIAGITLASLFVSCASKSTSEQAPRLNAHRVQSRVQPFAGTTTIFATPVAIVGSQNTCPGSYAGYASYTKTIANGWGWAPTTGVTNHTATDNNRSDTKIVITGKSGDSKCGQTTATITGNPPVSTVYRFTVYFPNNVPSTNYPLALDGFNP